MPDKPEKRHTINPRRQMSFKMQARANTTPDSTASGIVTDYFICYNLPWRKLEAWLDEHFPDQKPHLQEIFQDQYVLHISRRLTETERREVAALKEEPSPTRERIVESPNRDG